MLWCPFSARVKVNHRSIYSRILTRVCVVAMATGFCLVKRNPVVRLFSSFAHYELTLKPFCQQCSNTILTCAFFIIRQ